MIRKLIIASMGVMALAAWALMAVTPAEAATVKVTAVKAKKAPSLDGKIEKAWNKARRTKIRIKKLGTITAKALYTDKSLYLLFVWPDKTQSMNRNFSFKGGKWEKTRGNEDRFNVLWNINNSIKSFEKKGCQVTCHKNSDTGVDSMYTNGPNELGDLWHWKSQRTNPVGYADDQHITNEIDKSSDEVTGRHPDAKTAGSYASNWDESHKRPLFVAAGKKGGPFLIKAEAVKFTGSPAPKKGTLVPREVLARPTGSRGDVSAAAVWKKGKWTLEMERALTTGNGDDVQFSDLKKKYVLGISIHDNSGGDRHRTSPVVVLGFK